MNADADDIRGRAPRITAEDVLAAADALVLKGHRPTIDRVRMHLGRGSPNTINEHLDRWWRELGARLTALPGQTLPGVPDAVASQLMALWTLALRESQQALRTDMADREAGLLARETAAAEGETAAEIRRQAHADALHLAQQQLDEANQRARSLETTLQQARGDVEHLDRQAAGLRHELAESRRQLETAVAHHGAERTRLNERFDALQDRSAREIDRLQLTHKEDKKQLKELRTQLERLIQVRDRARTEQTRLETELTTLRGVNERLLTTMTRSGLKASAKRSTKRPASDRRGRK